MTAFGARSGRDYSNVGKTATKPKPRDRLGIDAVDQADTSSATNLR